MLSIVSSLTGTSAFRTDSPMKSFSQDESLIQLLTGRMFTLIRDYTCRCPCDRMGRRTFQIWSSRSSIWILKVHGTLSKKWVTVTQSCLHGTLQKRKVGCVKEPEGLKRYGLVVSSQANRLKPLAIDVRLKPDPIHWFLAGKEDVRSSDYLEEVATEFDIQGLELDSVCVTWDADLRFHNDGWLHRSFRGNKWQKVNKPDRQSYLKNAYRVLLTRARQGMIIVVPKGDEDDPTRLPSLYDSTFEYFTRIGIPTLKALGDQS